MAGLAERVAGLGVASLAALAVQVAGHGLAWRQRSLWLRVRIVAWRGRNTGPQRGDVKEGGDSRYRVQVRAYIEAPDPSFLQGIGRVILSTTTHSCPLRHPLIFP